jgi:hypothetical protein
MNLRWTSLALVLCAASARAEEKKPEERPVHVRASHQVDVIAPGERVETVIDRMRASAVPPGPEAKPLERNVEHRQAPREGQVRTPRPADAPPSTGLPGRRR